MIKMDSLDYGIYCEGKHIADFDDLALAKQFGFEFAEDNESDVVIINNFTGEICGEFQIRFSLEIVEVEP